MVDIDSGGIWENCSGVICEKITGSSKVKWLLKRWENTSRLSLVTSEKSKRTASRLATASPAAKSRSSIMDLGSEYFSKSEFCFLAAWTRRASFSLVPPADNWINLKNSSGSCVYCWGVKASKQTRSSALTASSVLIPASWSLVSFSTETWCSPMRHWGPCREFLWCSLCCGLLEAQVRPNSKLENNKIFIS